MGFGGYQDPVERAAAAEAARRAGEARALEDARTEALAAAIVEGLGLVANAILAAAGLPEAISGIPGPAAPSALAAEVCRAHGSDSCDTCDLADDALWVHPCDVADPNKGPE
jgi:hypothetical protein